MTKLPGKFIVLEGIDGSGTTTQVGAIADWCDSRGVPVVTLAQPSDGMIGLLIRQYLAGKLNPMPDWQTMMHLFAADRRKQFVSSVASNLEAGTHVICDRYILSSMVYQGVQAAGTTDTDSHQWYMRMGLAADRVRQVQSVPWPDVTLYLNVPAYVAWGRLKARGGDAEEFENQGFQNAVKKAYSAILPHVDGVSNLDGNQEALAVTRLCLEVLENKLGPDWAFAGDMTKNTNS